MRFPLRLAVVFTLVSLFAIGPTTNAEAPADLPVEDSFESGTAAPDEWSQGIAVPGVKYVYDRHVASDGKRSLGLQKSANRFFPIAAWSRAFKHESTKPALQVSAKVKAQKASKAIIDVLFLDANGQMIKHEWIAYIGQKEATDPLATHNWKTYGKAVEIPAGTMQIDIALQIYGPGKVWFDELQASYVDAAGELKTSEHLPTTRQTKRLPSRAETSPIISVKLKSGGVARYLLIPPKEGETKPAGGYPLLFVLPGGNGSEEFHPFVRSIHQESLDGRFFVVQPLAPPQVVWPTESSIGKMESTEASIAAILHDVSKTQPIDRNHVLALAWSSSGPAAYATMLKEASPLSGALIAMSVFKPQQLPPLAGAAQKRVYFLHSPADTVTPFRMAQEAERQLASAGAAVKLAEYTGGHGWHGPVFDNIRAGIEWLQQTDSP